MTSYEWLYSRNTIKRSKKGYAHFDVRTNIEKQRNYISDPCKVAAHGFYPFIHYQKQMNKFSREQGIVPKTREICYAAHIDRCIYQYYSFLINQMYNERADHDGIAKAAVAYRTNFNENNNIHFSKWAFDKIKQLGKAYIMIGDFTDFFDNLDHSYLKQQCCSLLRCQTLPDDYYSVFKNITAYSKWELKDILSLNGLEDTVQGRRKLNKMKRVLTPKQFKENCSYIEKNTDGHGIPQGSPISAVLANVYMLEVDKKINDIVQSLGGMYMRYSDDFIVILPDCIEQSTTKLLKEIHDLIDLTPGLTLKPSKTQYYSYDDGMMENLGKTFDADSDATHRFINFLGFTFDGKQVFIRPKTISKYYHRMYRKANYIVASGGFTCKGNRISCGNLYRVYSERGAYAKRGNFLSYVKRAEKVYTGEKGITRDTRRHMQKIRKALNGKS